MKYHLVLAAGLMPAMLSLSAEERFADTLMLKEVQVSAPAKTQVELLPLNVTTISSMTLERTAESSLLPVFVNKVPGLFVTERGFAGYGVSGGSAGAVNIRGVGQGNKVLFMIDGQPHWAGVFGHSLPDTYVTNGVERVEIVKGPASLLYGANAMGGSVNIITKRAHEDGVFGRARAMFGSFSTQKFNVATGFKNGKWGGTIAGQVDRSDGNREGSDFWNANEFMQLQYDASDNWNFGVNLDMTQTKANNPGTLQSPLEDMWTKVFRGTASMYAKNRYAIGEGGVQTYINWGRNKVDDGHAPDAAPRAYLFNSTDYNIGFTVYETLHLWEANNLSLGVDFMHWGGHTWNTDKADSKKTEGVDKSENEIAGYAMMQQGFFADRLSVNGGVRLQHGSSYGNIWIPQAGFVVKPLESSSVKFSFGKGFRAPTLRELYMYAPANPDLKPEYMYNYEVELRQWLLDRRLNVGVALFYIDGKDMIQVQMVDGRPRNMNSGAFRNKGFEIDATWHINRKWNVNANYSYLHSDNNLLVGAPKNKLNAEINYSVGGLAVTVESNTIWSLRTGNPDNSTLDYSLLNLRMAYTFTGKSDIMPFVKLDNITDKHYEIIYGCPMPGITILGGIELKF